MERALTYVLGYLLEAGGSGAGNTGDARSLLDYLATASKGGRVLAIKLRADNDFYSQTSQVVCRHADIVMKSSEPVTPLPRELLHDAEMAITESWLPLCMPERHAV